MAALRGDPAVGEQHDPVGVVQPERGHRGHHGRAAPAVRRDPLGDAGLGVRVDRGGGLDEHEHLGVDGQRPGEHHALALAAGEPASALVDLAGPAAGQGVVDVLGAGDLQRLLRLLTGEHAVRVDRVLQGAGEQLGAGVADQHGAAHLLERDAGEVDPAVGHAPGTRGPLGVGRGDPGPARAPLGARAAPAAPAAGLLQQRRRLLLERQPAAQPVGELGRGLRQRAHHDGQQPGAGHEPGALVDQVPTRAAGTRLVAGAVQGGVCSRTATALRAETSDRVSFWANSKKVRIGPTMNRP